MQPRIFISSVTAELGTTRQLAANVLTRLHYTPVWQDVFGLEAGDLRDVLRQKIDDCDGLVHLVGQAYNKLGIVVLQLGRTDDAQQQYEGGLKIRLVLAEEDPSSSEKQRDLMISHYKLGQVMVAQQQFTPAIGRFEQGIAILDRLIDQGLLIESAGKEKAILECRIAFCREELKKAKQ
jgi:hypothetical protein